MKLNPLIVCREEFDGSAILFNPDTGDTYGLNPVALLIWKAIEEGLDKAAIMAKLAEACKDPRPQTAEADYDQFVATLQTKGYVSC